MKKLDRFIDVFSAILCKIAAVILCIMLLAVVVNVVGRRLFHFTIGGIIELVQYGMLTVMCLIMIRTTYSGGHVAVSVLTEKLPKSVSKVIAVLALLFAAALVGIAAYVSFKYVPINYASRLTTDYYHIPFYLVYLAVGLGLGSSALTFVYNAVTVIFPVHGTDKEADSGPAASAEQ